MAATCTMEDGIPMLAEAEAEGDLVISAGTAGDDPGKGS